MKGKLLLAGILWAGTAFAGVEPGNWQFTVEVSMQSGGSSGPIVKTRCITEEEARDPQRVIAEAGQSGCDFTNARDTGSEYSFDVNCKGGPVPVHGSGRVSYTAQTMDGVIDLVAEQQNLTITTHSKVNARRLGSCNS